MSGHIFVYPGHFLLKFNPRMFYIYIYIAIENEIIAYSFLLTQRKVTDFFFFTVIL